MNGDLVERLQLLIVHGDEAVRRRLGHAAERTGCFHPPLRMENARFALEAVLDSVLTARKDTPDVIVVDLALPGLGGVAFTRELRRCDPRREILIAFLASAVAPGEQDAAETAGADFFLRRPVAPDDLARVLRALAVRVHTQRDYARLDARIARRRYGPAMLTDNVV